jgi:NAD(P) transhydrogenase subunit beta
MSANLATAAYVAATILFILSLGGLSNPETSRRGNLYGIVGMAIAVLATVFGPRVTAAGIPWIVGALAVGAVIGLYAARSVKIETDSSIKPFSCKSVFKRFCTS